MSQPHWVPYPPQSGVAWISCHQAAAEARGVQGLPQGIVGCGEVSLPKIAGMYYSGRLREESLTLLLSICLFWQADLQASAAGRALHLPGCLPKHLPSAASCFASFTWHHLAQGIHASAPSRDATGGTVPAGSFAASGGGPNADLDKALLSQHSAQLSNPRVISCLGMNQASF